MKIVNILGEYNKFHFSLKNFYFLHFSQFVDNEIVICFSDSRISKKIQEVMHRYTVRSSAVSQYLDIIPETFLVKFQ